VSELIIPEPHRIVDIRSDDGAIVRFRQHGNLDGPRLMVSHGNGFAADGYFGFWRHLMDDYEIIAHDLRNHGANPLHGPENHNYETFVADYHQAMGQLPDILGAKPTAGLYHSASALTALHYVPVGGFVWDALVLFDPPIMPADGHPLNPQSVEFEGMMADWAAKRPERFASPDQIANGFRKTKSLSGWEDGIYDILARAILKPDGDEWVLACPAAMESALYRSQIGSDLWQKLPAAAAHADKIIILASDNDVPGAKPPARVLPAVAEEFGFPIQIVPGTTHLLQMEEPAQVAELTRAFLKNRGL